MSNGIVLSLDLATRTGWASGPVELIRPHVGRGEPKPESGSKSFPGSLGSSLAGLSKFIYKLVQEHEPTVVVFEAPLDPRHLGKRTNKAAGRKLIAMAGIAEMVAFRFELPVREVAPLVIKRHWTGSTKAKKEDMLHICKLKGWNVTDDNEADALALLDYTCGMIRLESAKVDTKAKVG